MVKLPQSRPQRQIVIGFIAVVVIGLAWLAHEHGPRVTPLPVLTGEAAAKADAAMQQQILKYYGSEVTGTAQSELVTRIGGEIINRSDDAKASGKPFRFHLISQPNIIDSFSLPGGDIFITIAFVNRMKTEGMLAAALSNSVAHVLAGDRMTLASDGVPIFTPEQESAVDAPTVKLMSAAGYTPEALPEMLQVLSDAYHAKADVTFFVTHPNSEWRLQSIDSAIKALYPKGVPAVLSK